MSHLADNLAVTRHNPPSEANNINNSQHNFRPSKCSFQHQLGNEVKIERKIFSALETDLVSQVKEVGGVGLLGE